MDVNLRYARFARAVCLARPAQELAVTLHFATPHEGSPAVAHGMKASAVTLTMPYCFGFERFHLLGRKIPDFQANLCRFWCGFKQTCVDSGVDRVFISLKS
jgi:hypothetical protein